VLSKTDLAGVNLVTVDVDAWKEEAIANNIRSVPTMVLYENNVELARKTGVMQSEQIKFLVNKQYGFTE
jgi:thioredoxin-like negative regulator of GroEL